MYPIEVKLEKCARFPTMYHPLRGNHAQQKCLFTLRVNKLRKQISYSPIFSMSDFFTMYANLEADSFLFKKG